MKNYDIAVNVLGLVGVGITYKILLIIFNKYYVNAKLPNSYNNIQRSYVRNVRMKHFKYFSLYVAPSIALTNVYLIGKSFISINLNGIELLDKNFKEVQNTNYKKSLFFIFNKKIFKNKHVRRFFICLLLLFFTYIFGVNTIIKLIIYFLFLIKIYKLHIYSLVLLSIVGFILYFIISLYILHIYTKKLDFSEIIYIPKTLPDFVVKYLEVLKHISSDKLLLKEIKRMYYIMITIFFLFALL